MLRFSRRVCALGLLAGAWTASVSPSHAATPETTVPASDRLLPASTKAFVAVTDPKSLRENFAETCLGRLAQDESMKAFSHGMWQQIRSQLQATGFRLGLKVEDLETVVGGEAALAFIQPDHKDAGTHATVLLIDTTGKEAETEALLAKAADGLKGRGAKRETRTIDGVAVSVHTREKSEKLPALKVFQFVHRGRLVATDNEATVRDILARLNGHGETCLATSPAYQAVRDNLAKRGPSQLTWFVDPFGYAQVWKSIQGSKKKKGPDLVKVLKDQGFTAIQAIGGDVSFATGSHDILHETYVHAPGASAAAERFKHAARMLRFPNQAQLDSPDWVGDDVSSCLTFQIDSQNAVAHMGSLVDAYLGEQGAFESVLDGLANDPAGPRVDLKKDLFPHLGRRVTLIGDYRLPITPKSERVCLAIEVVDTKAVRQTLARIMLNEPHAHRIELAGQEAWEMRSKQDDDEGLEVAIGSQGDSDPSFVATRAADPEPEEGAMARLPRSVFAVTEGRLLMATHVDVLAQAMQAEAAQPLNAAPDYRRLKEALAELGRGERCSHYFVRTSESYRATYELIRQKRMVESESLLGWALNKALAGPKGSPPRKQWIDGEKLPDYEKVAPFLGPAGFQIETQEHGWRIAGCLLQPAGDTPPLDQNTDPQTAAADEPTKR